MTLVTAVVVTYNRHHLLTECLQAVATQSHPPSRTVVVDNASVDGTAALLAGRTDVDVVTLRRNIGGAGGFAAGIQEAMKVECDALWLLDDDTVPETDALAELVRLRESYPAAPPSVLASRVVWTDGRDHPMNTPRARVGATRAEVDAATSLGARPIRSASFVSILVDRRAAEEAGLPVAAYFLWNDDFEYTARLLRTGVGLYCPSSVVVHKTATFGSVAADPGERFYFEVRNKVWTFTRSRALSPWEKLMYGGSTLNRWALTIQASSNRPLLTRALRRGLRDGLRSPQATSTLVDEAQSASSEPGGAS